MPTIEQSRAWYPTDPVHGFDHVLRVYRLAEYLALQESADLEIVHAAVLLHDVDISLLNDTNLQPTEPCDPSGLTIRASHHHSSSEFARKVLQAEGWPETRISAVQHCIRAHRFRDATEPPKTLEAQILFDADKLDAIGAVGVARAIAYAVTHGQPVFAEPSERFLNTGQTEPGEPHSAYHEYVFKLRYLHDRLYTPAARVMAEERHRRLNEFFNRLAIENKGLG
jgi:uncharacterized protein